MKKSTLVYSFACFLVLFFGSKCFAQYSLQTAHYLPFFSNMSGLPPYGFNHDSLPPFSSVLPAGPDYGLMSVSTRPLWYYFPSCITAPQRRVLYQPLYGGSIPGQYQYINVSAAIWGPFDNLNNITLAQLDASKLLASYNGITTKQQAYSMQIPNLDTGKVYIFVVASDDTLTNQIGGFAMDLNFGGNLSPYTSECILCNGKAGYFEKYNGPCALTVDTPGNYPHLIWRKNAADIGIAGYYVGRLNVAGTLDTLTYIDYVTGLTEYLDTAVSAVQKKREYKIIPVDSCGQINTNNTGITYGTIYLQSYPGLNNEVNLTWDYSGLIYITKSLIPIFYIWRYSGINPPVLVDSVALTFAPLTEYYTDISAPAGPTKYSIEIRYTDPCFAMKSTSTYSSAFSNPSGVVVLGVKESGDLVNTTVSPNPVMDENVTVNFGQPLKQNAVIRMIAMDGKIVDQFQVSKGEVRYSCSTVNCSPGIYQLLIESNACRKVMKIAISN